MEKIEINPVEGPKKRGRKPGSKNKVKSKRASKKVAYLSAFSFLEQEIQSLSNALKKATAQAEKEIEKLEKKQAKDIEKVKAAATKSLTLWKDRAKKNRLKALSKGTVKRSRPAKPQVEKVAGRRGRPLKTGYRKGGGRKKAGELTKRDVILNYIAELSHAISSRDLISALFERSGERDKKRFSQGIYTTLTQMYKAGSLVRDGAGMISIAK
ncbi:MAG: hypothetical protein O2814_02070 [Bacteroidetes bacterium]|nr:hypothetical protein [Bacteroidota bacterium]MDA1224389.1 hypothetical protein [Bacteroidota bacterium]